MLTGSSASGNSVSVAGRRDRLAHVRERPGLAGGRSARGGSRPSHASYYVLALPRAVLGGERLTSFLAQVAPFGCPPPPSLIRAYSLPDAPYPSILLKEHEDAPDGIGAAYRRFLTVAGRHWMAALDQTGPGLCPVLAWEVGAVRRLLRPEEGRRGGRCRRDLVRRGRWLSRSGLAVAGDPDLGASWQTLMSLGGPTKLRKITGREFPVWVDLPAHHASLPRSPVLGRIESLL